MITLLSHCPATADYYRVDIGYNLFGEYTVVREWGRTGRGGRHVIAWFSNLRDAVGAADLWHGRATAKGYALTERAFAEFRDSSEKS